MHNYKFLVAVPMLLLATAIFAQQQPPASVVQVASVSRTEIAPTIAVPGTIYSRNELLVTAGVAGQLLMVAEPGTMIRQGESIARIDDTPLLLQRAEQEALLERAYINIRQFESLLRRQKELSDSNLVSQLELEQTQADRDLAISDANITKVRIRQSDDQIRRANIRAPFSGVVISRAHRTGEDVSRGEVLAQMTTQEKSALWCRRVMFAHRLLRSESTCQMPPRPAGLSDNSLVLPCPFGRAKSLSRFHAMRWFSGITERSYSALPTITWPSASRSKSAIRPAKRSPSRGLCTRAIGLRFVARK